jgi:hypothetical protein
MTFVPGDPVHTTLQATTDAAHALDMRKNAVALFFLAPLVAEFLLGDFGINALFALLFLAPMYGGGAILIREFARRTGRGWPTMLLLALAYGVIEEGLVTQSLFNPDYAGLHLLEHWFVPGLGISVPWTLTVLAVHTIWSISVPIALVETLVPGRRTTPWLGTTGLAVTAALFVLGVFLNGVGTYTQQHFLAAPGQLTGSVLVVVGLIVAASRIRGPQPVSDPSPAPSPWLVGAVAFGASSVFLAAGGLRGWPLVAGYLVLYAVMIVLVLRWSRRAGWGPAHRLALAGGALLTYAWNAFPQPPVLGATGTADLIGNTVFATGAVALLLVAARTVRRAPQDPDGRAGPPRRGFASPRPAGDDVSRQR